MDFYCITCIADTLPFLNLDNNKFELTAHGIDVSEEMFLSGAQFNSIQFNSIFSHYKIMYIVPY